MGLYYSLDIRILVLGDFIIREGEIMDARETRRLIALHRGTRQAHARIFIRCKPYMIALIDELRREE